MTTEVILGKWYRHDIDNCVMMVEEASVPSQDNWVCLVDREISKSSPKGFHRIWRGTWNDFLDQWSPVRETL